MSGKQAAISSPVAKNLRLAQAAAGVSNTELALAIGVKPRTVGRWRSGEAEPTWAHVVAVAKALDRDPHWFYAKQTLLEAA